MKNSRIMLAKNRTQKFPGKMFIQVRNGLDVNNHSEGKSRSCQQMTHATLFNTILKKKSPYSFLLTKCMHTLTIK